MGAPAGGEAAGMAAHESQSLIVEMQACRSDAFLGFLGGELHRTFGGDAAPTKPRTSPACGAAWSAASSAWTPTS
jgi:Zn-dependent M32 family carboxypeptidase